MMLSKIRNFMKFRVVIKTGRYNVGAHCTKYKKPKIIDAVGRFFRIANFAFNGSSSPLPHGNLLSNIAKFRLMLTAQNI